MKRVILIALIILLAWVAVSHAEGGVYLNGNSNYPQVVDYQGKASYLDLNSAIIKGQEKMPDGSVMKLVNCNLVLVNKDNTIEYYLYSCKLCVNKDGSIDIFNYYPSGYGYNDNQNDVSYKAGNILRSYLYNDLIEGVVSK